MRTRSMFVLGAGLALWAVPALAQDGDDAAYRGGRARYLPPISGTIRLAPGAFGTRQQGWSRRRVETQAYRGPAGVQVIRGGGWAGAYRTLEGDGVTSYAPRSSYQANTSAERWASGGTGLVSFIGNTGNPFAGQARWGTADSATTGAAYQAPIRYGAERPLDVVYGEPALLPGVSYAEPSYGAAPQLSVYGSGRPSTLGYYSSGSSAGPYGSPGGLAVYRSGSYGVGPRIVTLGSRAGRSGVGCTCGPHILRLGREHPRHVVAR